jgi:hypothetical protein
MKSDRVSEEAATSFGRKNGQNSLKEQLLTEEKKDE